MRVTERHKNYHIKAKDENGILSHYMHTVSNVVVTHVSMVTIHGYGGAGGYTYNTAHIYFST